MLAAALSQRRFSLRALVGALLAPLLVVGALDLHSTELPHGALDGPTEILTDAQHPLAPEHFEASESVVIPHCFACLLRTNTSSGVATPPALEPEPVVTDAAPAPIARLQPFSLAYGLGSRGPPLT
jgi:hypothetical protein